MIDELGKRRPELDETNSVPVVLADGQAWHLPKPWIELWPTFRRGVAVDTYPVLTYGPDLDRLVEALSQCEDVAATLCGAATLGAYMVTRNYDLADAELDQLFCFRLADPATFEWAKAVIQVATGAGAKKA